MNDWQIHGTTRQHDIFKTLGNPLEVPEYQENGEAALNYMLAENDPPEIRTTLERLVGLNLPEDYARWLVSCGIAAETIATAEGGSTEGWGRLISRLTTLRESPWIVDDH